MKKMKIKNKMIRQMKSKKGVFLSFIAIIFLSLLIISVSIGANYVLREKTFLIETKVDTMNNLIIDIDKDLQRAIHISGFRTMVALENEVTLSGEYIDDIDERFQELFFYGTLYQEPSFFIENNTFPDWLNKIGNEAERIDVSLNLSTTSFNVHLLNPWEVEIDVNVSLDMVSNQGIAEWHQNKTIGATISIIGFEDPIYRLGTNGLFENTIRQSNKTFFRDGGDVSLLLNHTLESEYIAYSGAPDYFMRLEGNFSPSENGIESLVDLQELYDKSISIKDKSVVDFIYFSDENPDSYNIEGMPSWFKIDDELFGNFTNFSHLELYDVEDLKVIE